MNLQISIQDLDLGLGLVVGLRLALGFTQQHLMFTSTELQILNFLKNHVFSKFLKIQKIFILCKTHIFHIFVDRYTISAQNHFRCIVARHLMALDLCNT